jgi:hypothetical protein
MSGDVPREIPTAEREARLAVGAEARPNVDVTEFELTPPVPDGRPLEVVIAGTERPLPGAVVTFLGRDAAKKSWVLGLAEEGGGRLHPLLDTLGVHSRCDARGRVSISRGDPRGFARARGVLDGVHYVGLRELDVGVTRILVAPESGFDVHVVDARGVGVAGVGLELRVANAAGVSFVKGTGTTAESGWVFLPNHLAEDEQRDVVQSASIRLAGLFDASYEVPVEWEGVGIEEVVLERPETGRLRVSVEDARGADVSVGHVWVQSGGEPGARYGHQLIGLSTGSPAVVFEPVQVGLSVDVYCGSLSAPARAEALGVVLHEAGETLDVRLVDETEAPWMTGRVLLTDGALCAGERIAVGMPSQNDAAVLQRMASVRTAADGTFALAAPWFAQGDFVVSLGDLSADVGSIEEPGPDGRIDLGDVVLEPLELLAAGRVVERGGAGISVPLELLTYGAGPDEDYPTRRWELTSHADGTFEFRGRTPAERLSLKATSDDFVGPRQIRIETGDLHVALELQRAGHFTFDIPAIRALFGARPSNSFTYKVARVGKRADGRGNAFFGSPEPLVPGLYHLRFFLGWNDAELLHEVEFEIRPGAMTDLGDLYFTHELYTYELQIELLGEGYAGAVHIEPLRSSPKPLRKGLVEDLGGGAKLLFTTEPISEVVATFGGKTETFPVVEGENTIEFVVE